MPANENAPASPLPLARRWLPRVGAAVLFLAIGGGLFPSAGNDDAYISYWPAYTLASQGRILNYNGEAIEQSSSLLQVLLVAAGARATGLALPWVGWGLSVLAGLATLLATDRLVGRIAPPLRGATLLVLALAVYLVYWSFSGMEASLASLTTVLLLGALVGIARPAPRPRDWIALTLATLLGVSCRPEAPFVIGAAMLGFAALGGLRAWQGRTRPEPVGAVEVRRALGGLGILLGVTAGVILGRLGSFDAAFPQPVSAKFGGLTQRALLGGLSYGIVNWAVHPLLALAALGAWRVVARALRGEAEAPWRGWALALLLAQGAFIVGGGGDWMEGGRFLVPVLPLLVLFALDAGRRLAPPRLRVPGTLLLAAFQVMSLLLFARSESHATPLWTRAQTGVAGGRATHPALEHRNRVHLRDLPTAQALEDLVSQIQQQRPEKLWILTGQGGVALYYTFQRHEGRLGVIDRRGLLDRRLTSSATARGFGRDAYGLAIRDAWIVHLFDSIHEECGVPRPDIILDLRFLPDETRVLRRYGYEPVYEQAGVILAGSTWLPGDPIWARQKIFVRRELLPLLDASFPRDVGF